MLLDAHRLVENLETYLEEYNAESKKPMDLVLFMFATEHLTRIARIMSMPGGNALLVGMGGSGRQSLTRLAAFVLDFGIKQIELSKNYGMTEWRDDIRQVIKDGKYSKAKRARMEHCSYRHSALFDLIPLLMSSIESYLSNKPKQCILKIK